MASKDGMLEVMLWLSPIAKDLLRDVSKSLRGAVPCPNEKLASALGETGICEGVLRSAEVRKSLAAEIKSLGEISDKTAPGLVDALGKVLSKEIDGIKKQAAATQSKLKTPKAGMLGYSDLADVAKSKQALGNDWMIWHSAANGQDAKSVSTPPAAVLAERTAVAASCPDGPIGELATALHVLENIVEYIKWEKSLSGSKPPSAGIEVLCPFDDKTANEVAIRRALTTVLAPDVAIAVLGEVAGDAAKVPQALKKVAADARKQAVIPMYAAPPAPKEPKDKKAKKGEDGGSKAAAKDGGSKAAAKPTAVPTVDAAGFNALHAATASEELQWQLLAYSLNPGTVLGRTMTEPSVEAAKPSPKGKQPASPKQAPGSPKSKKTVASALPSHPGASKPDDFQNIWSVSQGLMPPGHTDSSWASSIEPKANFQSIFACGANRPPGHTEMSWRSAASSCGATAPVVKPDKAKAAPKAASQSPKASPKASKSASPKASPKASPAAASGSVEDQIKAVGDDIRLLKEKLKSSGVTGKKLNDHPEITALVAKLTDLKSGAASAPAPAKGSPKASPKQAPKDAAPKKGGKKEKGGDAPAAEKELSPEEAAEARKKQKKASIKEGGKRGVEIEGAADMGGLQFFCTSVDAPNGDLELLEECMSAMNAKSDPTDEERKGGSGNIGKVIFSAGVEQLAVCAYVPEAKLGELSCEEWLKCVLGNFAGVITKTTKTVCVGKVIADSNKNIFPLKIREPMILEANNFLRKRGLFPEDDGSEDEMVFGDDDFPS